MSAGSFLCKRPLFISQHTSSLEVVDFFPSHVDRCSTPVYIYGSVNTEWKTHSMQSLRTRKVDEKLWPLQYLNHAVIIATACNEVQFMVETKIQYTSTLFATACNCDIL